MKKTGIYIRQYLCPDCGHRVDDEEVIEFCPDCLSNKIDQVDGYYEPYEQEYDPNE